MIYPSYGYPLEITTCSESTTFDTRLALFTGNCSSLNCWSYNDDSYCSFSNRSTTSTLITYASSYYYYLAVSGYNGAAGTYKLRIYQESDLASAGNCGDAMPLPFVPGNLLQFNGTTQNSEVSLVSVCSKPHRAPSTWYKIEIPSNYNHPITASTCNPGTEFDTMISVYSGSCDELVCAGHNDDNCSQASAVTWSIPKSPLPAPQQSAPLTFFIQVSGFITDSGNFELSIQ